MRDLEQIQELDTDTEEAGTRRLATLLMAAISTVGLVCAMGILLGRTADAAQEPMEDPLAALTELSEQAPFEGDAPLPEVDPESLRFPEALGNYEHRPEVVAAIAAAAAELEHPEPVLAQQMLAEPPALPVVANNTPPLPTSLPAAVAAGPGSVNLAKLREGDPLLQEALPEEAPKAPAPEGAEGKYTLQVASFQNQVDADGFATELRSRSHTAYVITADIPDRGRFWRVRIGPFETQGAANSYRRSFEAEEQMNSYVVRQRDAG